MLAKVEKVQHEIFRFESFEKKIRVTKVLLIKYLLSKWFSKYFKKTVL